MALQRDPNDAAAHARLGQLLAGGGDLRSALPHLRRAAQLAPSVANDLDLAAVLLRAGQAGEAQTLLRRIVETDPMQAEAWHNLGVSYGQQRRVPDAVHAFEQALKYAPAMHDARLNLARALAMLGRYADAVAVLERGLVDAPTEGPLLTALAWQLATAPDDSVRNGARAVELAERAVQAARPVSVGMLDVLAAAYAEAGRFDEALQTLDRALAMVGPAPGNRQREGLELRRRLFGTRQPYRTPRP